MPERPPRKQYSSSMNKKGGNSHHHQHHKSVGKSQDQDVTDLHDHHTLSTATTAAETISYSTDQGDASIASEVGMEVVMSVPSHDHQDDHAPNTGTVTASTSMPMHTTASDTEPALMHEENTTRSFMAQRRLSSGAAARTNKPTLGSSYQSHSFPAGKHIFTVDRRYSMLRVIGSGAYGVVISATDSKTSNHKKNNTNNNNTTANNTTSTSNVAIKMVPKAFSDEIDAKRILREIKLLKHFRHDNIVRILDMMPPNVPYLEDFHDVYMVTDLMETDLHRIIYSKQKLSTDHAQYFIYQVLRGLKYIHSCKVLHRDLKPSNLLVNSNCDLKICDFGLARGVHQSSSGTDSPDGTQDKKDTMLLTEYVVTRWYRAPEIMLACHEYSYPIDVWSVGCIFAELLSRKPMFPGEDYIDQLTIISEKLGKLADADLDFVTSDKAKRFMRKLPSKAPPHFALVFPGTPPEALDSLRRMLEIHPHKRISVQAALQHPFFEPLHNPADEPVSSRPFDFGFEKGPGRLQRLKLQELIWKEVVDFRPHDALPVAQSRRQPGATAAPTTTATTAAAKV